MEKKRKDWLVLLATKSWCCWISDIRLHKAIDGIKTAAALDNEQNIILEMQILLALHVTFMQNGIHISLHLCNTCYAHHLKITLSGDFFHTHNLLDLQIWLLVSYGCGDSWSQKYSIINHHQCQHWKMPSTNMCLQYHKCCQMLWMVVCLI